MHHYSWTTFTDRVQLAFFYCRSIQWEMFGRIMTLGCRAERGRKSKDLVWFGLMLNDPVNNFSAMLGRSHRCLCITSIFFIYLFFFFWGGGGNMSCSRTQHGDSSGVRTPDFWIQSPELLATRQLRPHQVRRTRYETFINVAKHSEMCWIPLSASHDFGCRSGHCRFHWRTPLFFKFSSDASSLIRCFLYLNVQV